MQNGRVTNGKIKSMPAWNYLFIYLAIFLLTTYISFYFLADGKETFYSEGLIVKQLKVVTRFNSSLTH